MPLTERTLQDYIGRRLKELGWSVVEWGRGIKGERDSLEEVILKGRFFKAIERINGIILEEDEKKDILTRLTLLSNTIEGIKSFLDFVKNGIPIKLIRGTKEIPKQLYLFDFENVDNNDFLAVREFEVEENDRRRRFDLCLFVNGIPLVVIETKNPFHDEEKRTTWYDAYKQVLEYEEVVPSVFKYVQFSIVSNGHVTKYFPNYYAKDYSHLLEKDRGVWKSFYPYSEDEVENRIKPLMEFPFLDSTIFGMLSKRNLLDLIENFIFVKKYKDTYIKVMAWYMQFEASNLIVKRVLEERDKKLGLIWHWQGSGKTLTMAFSAWKLLRCKKLENPTIFIVVDRRDLQRQIIGEEFAPLEIAAEEVKSTEELINILKWGGREREGKRGIFVCLIQKFKPNLKKLHDAGEINLERENIIIFTDESHRSQYGVLASTMRGIFKNAFIFGFTGTPLSKPERNTFQKFSPRGELYLSRYRMIDSMQDGFTLPIRYEVRLPELHLREEEIEELAMYEGEVLDELEPEEVRVWRRKIKPKLALLKSDERVGKVCSDIAEYFKGRIEETPLKAMVATVDRESCVLFKKYLDKLLGPKYSEVVMTYQAREESKAIEEYKRELVERFGHSDFERINNTIIDRFRNEEFPRIVIVSDMLLTGFDAKNLWVLFLYKPLKEHRLLQAIARTNRPYKELKEFGLVVDYIGVARNLEKALQQFEGDFVKEATLVIRDLRSSEEDFEKYVKELKEMFKGVEISKLEDVEKAVEALILSGKEEEFVEKTRKLVMLYELLSPSEVTFKHLETYKQLVSISTLLKRRRNIGINLPEIEKMARKTYELIQRTIGVDKIEKIGEVEIDEELHKLELEGNPVNALRVLGEIYGRVSGSKSEFYVSLRKEVEDIYEKMKKEKKVTKEVIDRIKFAQQRLKDWDEERRRLGEVFPIFAVLRDSLQDQGIALEVSKRIVQKLKEGDLLSKESFLKDSQRKRIRKIIREEIIRYFRSVENLDEIERRIFESLEEEYG